MVFVANEETVSAACQDEVLEALQSTRRVLGLQQGSHPRDVAAWPSTSR